MTQPTHVDRRTVLKTITATTVGGLIPGPARATPASPNGAASGGRNVLTVTANHDHETDEHKFELDTHEFPSGWTTLKFDNATDHAHFVYVAKLPPQAIDDAGDQDLLEFYVEHVTGPFQFFMDTQVEGKEPDPDDLSDRYSNPEEGVFFPPWFENVLPSGGAGLTAADRQSTTTLHLDPGEYIVECYVKTAEEDFHSTHGMIDHVTVSDDRSELPAPHHEATATLTLSTDGIDAPETLRPGRHTVGVQFDDQQLYSHLLGHDVHLVRLDGQTTVEDVNDWMNWMHPGQLVSDGSEPGPFLGGVQTILTPGLLDGTASETAYLHANLEPGTYAWVSEVPNPAEKGLLTEFTVSVSAAAESRTPPADPGESRNWGAAPEAPDDDLSERAANSAMSPDQKAAFDALANVDREATR